MSDIDSQVIALKRRVAEADKAKMLAELKHQQAQQAVQDSSEKLKSEFGVTSLEEAKQLLISLKTEVEDKLSEAEDLMRKFEEST